MTVNCTVYSVSTCVFFLPPTNHEVLPFLTKTGLRLGYDWSKKSGCVFLADLTTLCGYRICPTVPGVFQYTVSSR